MPEVEIPSRFDLEELSQPIELAPVQRQVVLQRCQARRHIAHSPFQAVDARADRADLGRKLRRPLLCAGDFRVERRQLSVDRVLAGVDVARRGRGDDERGQRCESETAHRTKLSRRNGPSLLPSSAYEACGGGSGCGGDGSGVGSGAGVGIGGSDGTGVGSGTVTGCGGSEGTGIGSGTCGGSTTAVA